MRTIFFLLAVMTLGLLLFSACWQPGVIPSAVNNSPVRKGLYGTGNPGDPTFRQIEMVVYIDTEKYNPLNALDYSLKDSGLLFFDNVILSGAYIRQDAHGYYLDLSDSLKRLLSQRRKYIEPLQQRGINVLLGVKSAGSASFGYLNEDEMRAFSRDLHDIIKKHRFNGVEFFDNADPSVYPAIFGYNPAVDYEFESASEWLAWQWSLGGQNYSNFFYLIWRSYFNNLSQELELSTRIDMRDRFKIFVREAGFGRLIPEGFSLSEAQHDFTGTQGVITASFNPFFNRFPENSSICVHKVGTHQNIILHIAKNGDNTGEWYGNDEDNPYTGDTAIFSDNQYSPLAIDLSGGPDRNIYYPYLSNADQYDPEIGRPIDEYETFSDAVTKFRNHQSEWQYIFFNNLRPMDDAKTDPYFKNLHFDPYMEETSYNNEQTDKEIGFWNPRYIPQEYILWQIAQVLFKEEVEVAPGGGNHVKDW